VIWLDPGRKTLRVLRFGAPQPDLIPAASLPGLQPVKTFTLSVVADPPRYTIFLDQAQVADVTDPYNTVNPAFQFEAWGHLGTVHITELRVSNLPGS
jgi:hypothetical protein